MQLNEKAIRVQKVQGTDTVIFKNPTRSQVQALMARYEGMRGLLDEDNLFLGDAMEWTHMSLFRKLQQEGLVDEDARFGQYIFLVLAPENQRVDATYGRPTPFYGWSMYTGNDLRRAKMMLPFQRIMPAVPTIREMIEKIEGSES